MSIVTAKQEAIEAIQRLPDTISMEEIMYRLYVIENIRYGQKDVVTNNTLSAEQVLSEIQSW